MKITEETKIKDLIQDEYEFEATYKNNEAVIIRFKKKQQDFAWYVDRYLAKLDESDLKPFEVNVHWGDIDVECFPFEFRIGLLKFICDEMNANLNAILLRQYTAYVDDWEKVHPDGVRVIKLCPDGFIRSLT